MSSRAEIQAELDRTNRMIKNLEEYEPDAGADQYGATCAALILAWQHRRHLSENLLPTARMREEVIPEKQPEEPASYEDA